MLLFHPLGFFIGRQFGSNVIRGWKVRIWNELSEPYKQTQALGFHSNGRFQYCVFTVPKNYETKNPFLIYIWNYDLLYSTKKVFLLLIEILGLADTYKNGSDWSWSIGFWSHIPRLRVCNWKETIHYHLLPWMVMMEMDWNLISSSETVSWKNKQKFIMVPPTLTFTGALEYFWLETSKAPWQRPWNSSFSLKFLHNPATQMSTLVKRSNKCL